MNSGIVAPSSATHIRLSPRQTGAVFVLEGVNSFGTTLYFYYLYFFTERQFDFTKFQNLLLAAALGLAYGLSSIIGGRIGQRCGYFFALKLGYGLMAAAIGIGTLLTPLTAHFTVMSVAVFGMALTWPALEALVSEGQTRRGLQRNVGIYNLVWGSTGALGYFCGGAIIDAGGFSTLFGVSAALSVVQLVSVWWLQASAVAASARDVSSLGSDPETENANGGHVAQSSVSPQTFLKMAWLANPFGYLAINTVIAVIPNVAHRLELNVVQAGFFCSVWLFVRSGSFLLLWLWPGWHYRFGWLSAAYVAMTASFLALLVSANLWAVIAAQVVFGLALGLLYYSSLYYSMHVGDTKGEHGGFHEAMIGLGSFAGPAIGATGLFLFPQINNVSTWAATGLLGVGFAALQWLRWRRN